MKPSKLHPNFKKITSIPLLLIAILKERKKEIKACAQKPTNMDETIQTSSKFQENNIHSTASDHNTQRKKENRSMRPKTNKQTWIKPSKLHPNLKSSLKHNYLAT
jgi:hypothetical protein